MSEELEIIVTDNEKITNALVVPGAMDTMLAEVLNKIKDFKGDVSTNKGRKEIASVAYKVARTKTTIDNFGKELVGKAKIEIKKIDDARKKARDTLDKYKEVVRKDLNTWEADRAAAEALIERIAAAGESRIDDPVYGESLIEDIENTDISKIDEDMMPRWVLVRDNAIAVLRESTAVAIQRIEDAKELERLRKNENNRVRKEAEAERQRVADAAAQAKIDATNAAPVPQNPSPTHQNPPLAAVAPAPAPVAAPLQLSSHTLAMNDAFRSMIKHGVEREMAIMLVKAIDAGGIPSLKLVY